MQKERKKALKRMRPFCVRNDSCSPVDHECHDLEPDTTESDHRWDDIIMKEKEIMEELQSRKEILEKQYGDYTDPQPCFAPKTEVSKFKLPSYMEVHDRISVKAFMYDLESVREQAKEVACYYRDRFYESKVKIKELEARNAEIQAEGLRQSQKVRYFWRNQVLEEESRSGRILKMALTRSPSGR